MEVEMGQIIALKQRAKQLGISLKKAVRRILRTPQNQPKTNLLRN